MTSSRHVYVGHRMGLVVLLVVLEHQDPDDGEKNDADERRHADDDSARRQRGRRVRRRRRRRRRRHRCRHCRQIFRHVDDAHVEDALSQDVDRLKLVFEPGVVLVQAHDDQSNSVSGLGFVDQGRKAVLLVGVPRQNGCYHGPVVLLSRRLDDGPPNVGKMTSVY